MKISPIISAQDLMHLEKDRFILIDAGSAAPSYEAYLQSHLKGALYVDLNRDLADIPEDPKRGGRHPLPSLEKFSLVLQNLGIGANSHIIIYDDKSGANAAARFWWMLRSAGIENVQVLDGGIQEALRVGFPVTSALSTSRKAEKMELRNWNLATADINEVEHISENPDFLVIDVREEERFNGEEEPIDLVAGHIPGASNHPFKNNLTQQGTFKTPEVLREYFTRVLGNRNSKNVIIHCGSGVTACHTILAMDYAGLELPQLYVGSWSEWSRNNKTVATNI